MNQTTLDRFMSSKPQAARMPILTPQTTDSVKALAIHHSFLSGEWDWSGWMIPAWRSLFYAELIRQSYISSPLQLEEARAYLSSLKSVPVIGFFPRPDIAAKSLSLTRKLMSVCSPLQESAQMSSTLCAPLEHFGRAGTRVPKGTFLGFHSGWIYPPATSFSDAERPYAIHLRVGRNNATLLGWDTQISAEQRAKIYPLSHINEFIWTDDSTSNPNNLGSSATGMVTSRAHISKGAELTLGYGLYDYDWGHYKLTLLRRALDSIVMLGLLQTRPDIVAYAEMLLGLTRDSPSFASLDSHSGFPHELFSVVNGTSVSVIQTGQLAATGMSPADYVKQLGNAPTFYQQVAFRIADHPHRREPVSWSTLLASELKSLDIPTPLRRSSRLANSALSSLSIPTTATVTLSLWLTLRHPSLSL